MTSDIPSLAKIRERIDQIDDSILQNLSDRLTLIKNISAAKAAEGGGNAAMRPSREAIILRRLLKNFAGPGEPAVISRIWREIINGATLMQQNVSVAVCAPDKSVGYWDLARNHFGSNIPMTLHRSSMLVLRRVSEEPGTIGILPLPEYCDEDWWTGLASFHVGGGAPNVIWRLPFCPSGSGRFEELGAYVLGMITPEESGDDITLLAVETDYDTSRGRVADRLEDQGLAPRIVAAQERSDTHVRLLMVEIDAFATAEDPRLTAFASAMGDSLLNFRVLGAYPRPLAH